VSDSVWKKEISFRRKRDEAAPAPEPVVPDPPPASDSVAARQLAFQRRLEAAAAAAAQPAVPVDEPPAPAPVVVAVEPAPAHEPEAAEGAPSMWKKEISFRRKPRAEEPPAAAAEPEHDPEPMPVPPTIAPAESIWKKEITFRRKPSDEDPGSDSGESIWRKEISLRRKPDAARSDSIWRKEISLRRREARQAQIQKLAEQALAAIDAEAATEPWLAAPQLPPEPDPEPMPMPVPAPQLPPRPEPAAKTAVAPAGEAPASKSMWKRELSLPKPRSRASKPQDVDTETASEDPPAWPKHKRSLKSRLSAAKISLPKPASRSHASSSHQVKRLVGLKIGASQLAAARVANNGAAELVQVARQPLEQGVVVGGEVRDPEALADALKSFFARNKLPKKNVRLGIASNRIGVRIFDLVGIDDEKQLENAVRFRAQEALPIPLDEAVLDYHVLGQSVDDDGTAVQRVLLVVAYRELVDRYVSACRKAGITLAGVDLEAFALLRALGAPRDPDSQADSALVAVSIGHDRSTFAVSDGRICEFTRVIEWGGSTLNVAIARALDLAPSEVELVKRLVSLDAQSGVPEGMEQEKYINAVDAVRKQVQAFARELVSSLQFYQHQPGSLGIGEIVITGGTAGLVGLAGELERLIGVRVRVGDPLARMKVAKKLAVDEQLGSLAIAIGLGIED